MATTARQRISECVALMRAEGLIETPAQKTGLLSYFEDELATVGAPAPGWYFDIGIDETFRAKFYIDPYVHSLAAWEDVLAGVVGTKLGWTDGQSIEVVDRATAHHRGYDADVGDDDPYVLFVFHDTSGVLIPHSKIVEGLKLQIARAVQRGARFADA
jgi:hypothetical protein